MAREISPVCNFIFGSICTCLLTDMVDVELTIRRVMGIYTYCKDHTVESTIFTLCSKSVIPFPSLRCKTQAFKDDNRQQVMTSWNNSLTVQFSAPPKPSQNLRKHAIGKIRTRWSNCNHRFNPIKTNRYNTMNMKPIGMSNIDIVQPIQRKACEHFDPTCSYCKHEAPHPSAVHSDLSSEHWDRNKAKAKEQKSLIDFKSPEPNKKGTDQQTDVGKVTEVDDLPFQNLTIGQDKPKEDPLEVTDSLVSPPAMASVTASATADDTTEDTDGGLTEQKLRLQREEEEYDKIYISLISEEEESDMDTDTDDSIYPYVT